MLTAEVPMSAAARLRTTYADYLRDEELASERHAFHDGETYAMAGGSTVHALLATEVVRALGNALVGRPCAAVGADQRVCIDEDDATYPDVAVLCPPIERPPHDPHAVTNPTVIVEVLSPSTELWDRSGKFALYARLGSLQHYVLVAQDRWRVEHLRRMEDGAWRLTVHGPGDVLVLDAVDVRVSVDELYAKVEAFGGPGRDAKPAGPPRG
jgi:Uma2 family endonuclease